ncbi:hypothetical protein F4774DRAFT_225007 [Daldinia eschscholtzii]|nr:hypothetical protein F4774DRAFT_225007 [Daldinia eschscholtzii]
MWQCLAWALELVASSSCTFGGYEVHNLPLPNSPTSQCKISHTKSYIRLQQFTAQLVFRGIYSIVKHLPGIILIDQQQLLNTLSNGRREWRSDLPYAAALP